MPKETVTTDQVPRLAFDDAMERADMNMEMANIAEAKYQKLARILELIRMKATRRWKGEDYSEAYGEVRLGIEATAHLREIMHLAEKGLGK